MNILLALSLCICIGSLVGQWKQAQTAQSEQKPFLRLTVVLLAAAAISLAGALALRFLNTT
jgi:ABC-type Na+ efflux pump permease subunit